MLRTPNTYRGLTECGIVSALRESPAAVVSVGGCVACNLGVGLGYCSSKIHALWDHTKHMLFGTSSGFPV
jgi:hypothetical protein